MRRPPVRIRPGPPSGSVVQWQNSSLAPRRRRFDSDRDPPSSSEPGSLVQRQDTCMACRRLGFESPRFHQHQEVPWSNGQDATLSRWGCGFDSRWDRHHGEPIGSEAGSKPVAGWVRFPPPCPRAASIAAMHSTFNRGSEVRLLGGPPSEACSNLSNPQRSQYGSGRQAGADPPRPPWRYGGCKHRRRCTCLLSRRSRFESAASHHILAVRPRRPSQGSGSLRPADWRSGVPTAPIRQRTFYDRRSAARTADSKSADGGSIPSDRARHSQPPPRVVQWQDGTPPRCRSGFDSRSGVQLHVGIAQLEERRASNAEAGGGSIPSSRMPSAAPSPPGGLGRFASTTFPIHTRRSSRGQSTGLISRPPVVRLHPSVPPHRTTTMPPSPRGAMRIGYRNPGTPRVAAPPLYTVETVLVPRWFDSSREDHRPS